MKHKLYNRLLSLALAVGLVIGMLPSAAAVDTVGAVGDVQSTVSDVVDNEVSESTTSTLPQETIEPDDSVVESIDEGASTTEEEVSVPVDNESDPIEDEVPSEPEYIVPVNYTDVAPLLPPVFVDGSAATMMAANAFLSDPSDTDENGLYLSKDAVQTKDGAKITLQSYITGEVSSSEKSIPTDVVLVLDVSGSMSTYTGKGYVKVNKPEEDETYYVNVNGQYIEVECCNHSGGWFDSDHRSDVCYHHWVKKNHLKGDTTHYDTYDKYEYRNITRMDALKTAVNSFIDGVAADAQKDPNAKVQHRVSIVTYSSNSSIKKYLLDVSNPAKVTELKNTVNNLSANGATYTGEGMEDANTVFSSWYNDSVPAGDRKQVTVLFTDGAPGYSGWNSSDDETQANKAISQAKTMKDSGKTVYTIGMQSGADPNGNITNWKDRWGYINDNVASNRFLHFVSSNYPQARSMNNGGTKENDGYYLAASDSESLNEIFEKIKDEITTPSIDLDATTQVRDVVSEYFNAPAQSGVSVYTQAYLGNNTWGDKVPLNDAKISVSGNTVTVTNFNYKENFVSDTPRKNPVTGKTDFYGKKLIVEFDVTAKQDFFGGNEVPTNGTSSGVYQSNGKVVEHFEVPHVDVPLKYNFDVQDQTIYISQNATLQNLIQYVEGFVPGTKLNGAETAKNNDYVKIVYTVKDGQKVVGTYTVEAGSNVGTWNFADSSYNTQFRDCKDFTVSCEVQPTESGSQQNKDLGEKPAVVHVLIPKVSARDKVINLGDFVDISDCYDEPQVGDWVDKENHTSIPDPVNDAPDVTLNPTKVTGTGLPETGEYYPTQDSSFTLGVTVGGLTLTTGEYKITTQVIEHNPDGGSCVVPDDDTINHDFTIHVLATDGYLVIEKMVAGDKFANNGKPVFDFKLESKKDGTVYYYHVMIDKLNEFQVVTPDGGVKIPSGEYTITELSNQNYTLKSVAGADDNEDGTYKVTIKPQETTTVTFTNDPKNTDIPTDGGATENRVDKIEDGVIVWKKEVYGTDHHEAQPSPNPNDNKD